MGGWFPDYSMSGFSGQVDVTELSDALLTEIGSWQKSAFTDLQDSVKESATEAKKKIMELSKSTVNRRSGGTKHYRSCFTTRKTGDLEQTLWNRKYPLSHLLEDGHQVYNQYGGPYAINPRNSKYGTSGTTTHEFDMWEETEKHTEKYLYDKVISKFK